VENITPTKLVTVILLVHIMVTAVLTTNKCVLVLVKNVPATVVVKPMKDAGVIPLVPTMVIAVPTTKKNA